jgi:hypothetical protein
MYFLCCSMYFCVVLYIVCIVLCIVCVYMCTVPGGYPTAVKYIISYHIKSVGCSPCQVGPTINSRPRRPENSLPATNNTNLEIVRIYEVGNATVTLYIGLINARILLRQTVILVKYYQGDKIKGCMGGACGTHRGGQIYTGICWYTWREDTSSKTYAYTVG